MIGGILSGLIRGTAVCGVGLGVASWYLPPVKLALSGPDAGAVAVPAGSEFNQERADTAPVLPQTESRPGSPETPTVGQPALETATPNADTAPLDAPATGAAAGKLTTPGTNSTPGIEIEGEDAVGQAADVAAPPQPPIDDVPRPLEALATPETGTNQAERPQAPQAGASPELSVSPEGGVQPSTELVQPSQPGMDSIREPQNISRK